jgi:holo-[acyl-carrier protein] synthase
MLLGVGIDLLEITDFRRSLDRGVEAYRTRIFTQREIDYCQARADPYQSFTVRFAAKEAAIKALGLAGMEGLKSIDFEVVCESDERPVLRLSGKAEEEALTLGVKNLQISLSHSRSAATAVVIAEV